MTEKKKHNVTVPILQQQKIEHGINSDELMSNWPTDDDNQNRKDRAKDYGKRSSWHLTVERRVPSSGQSKAQQLDTPRKCKYRTL